MSETPGTALTLAADDNALTEINDVVTEGHLATREPDVFRRTLAMASALRRLSELITDEMMADIMSLQGKVTGFRTDKDDKGHYPVAVVKDCLIEATLNGARPVGNEFNIIAGKPYYTKNYFLRNVREYPGVTNLMYSDGEVEIKGGNAHVDYVVACEVDGQTFEVKKIRKKLADGTPFDDRVVVRVNSGMGRDAIIGKATARAFRAVFGQLLGFAPPEYGDVDDRIIDVPVNKKVQKSTLFADEPPEEEPPKTADDQKALVSEYAMEVGSVTEGRDLSAIAKKAGGDDRLTEASRKEIAAMCTDRRKSL